MRANISKRFKTKWYSNPLSGHEWSEPVKTNQYEVSGCGFLTTVHGNEKSAIKEKELRESMAVKFPFKMMRTEREMKSCKRLGLPMHKEFMRDVDIEKAIAIGVELI